MDALDTAIKSEAWLSLFSPPLQFSQGEKMKDIVKWNGIYVVSSFVNLTPWLQFFINNVQVDIYTVKKMPILLHRRGKKLTFYDNWYRSRKDWHTGFRYAHASRISCVGLAEMLPWGIMVPLYVCTYMFLNFIVNLFNLVIQHWTILNNIGAKFSCLTLLFNIRDARYVQSLLQFIIIVLSYR